MSFPGIRRVGKVSVCNDCESNSEYGCLFLQKHPGGKCDERNQWYNYRKKIGYKCVNCGVIKEPNSDAWQVVIYDNGIQRFQPTCSEKCACEYRDKYVIRLESQLDTMKRQCFQRMDWNKYGAKY